MDGRSDREPNTCRTVERLASGAATTSQRHLILGVHKMTNVLGVAGPIEQPHVLTAISEPRSLFSRTAVQEVYELFSANDVGFGLEANG
jgi:hypothetical protein